MAADKTTEDQLKAVWFAAGTAALMACVERAVVVSHWRVWAFLALNLLLLAILFTSKTQIQSLSEEADEEDECCSPNLSQKIFSDTKDMQPQSNKCEIFSEGKDQVTLHSQSILGTSKGEQKKDVKKEGHDQQISEEELNKRAEAFITMFRQHLVSDALNFRTERHRSSLSAKVY